MEIKSSKLFLFSKFLQMYITGILPEKIDGTFYYNFGTNRQNQFFWHHNPV